MVDLPEAVSMSTGVSSGDAEDADEAHCPIIIAAKSKLAGSYALEALPQTRDDPLWVEIKNEYALLLQELGALKNYACPVVAQPSPRGILRRIEDATLYRISDQCIRARFMISHIVNMRRYSFNADVLVDPGANTELKLPARKVMQLELLPVGRPVRTRGSTNDTTYIIHFSPVLVTATFDRDGTAETIEAYLDVKCDKNEYDHLLQIQQEEMEMTTETDEGQVLMTPNQPMNSHATTGSSSNNEGITVIQLSPTRHRPHDAPLQQAVIGIDGLRKLHMHLNCDQLQLEIEEDEWVEDEESESNLARQC